MQKRKTLLNSLSNSGKFGTKDNIAKILLNLGVDTKIRPEKLTLEQFAKISQNI